MKKKKEDNFEKKMMKIVVRGKIKCAAGEIFYAETFRWIYLKNRFLLIETILDVKYWTCGTTVFDKRTKNGSTAHVKSPVFFYNLTFRFKTNIAIYLNM